MCGWLLVFLCVFCRKENCSHVCADWRAGRRRKRCCFFPCIHSSIAAYIHKNINIHTKQETLSSFQLNFSCLIASQRLRIKITISCVYADRMCAFSPYHINTEWVSLSAFKPDIIFRCVSDVDKCVLICDDAFSRKIELERMWCNARAKKSEVLFYRVSWDTYDDFAYRVKCERIKNHYMKVVHALLWSMSWFPGYMH